VSEKDCERWQRVGKFVAHDLAALVPPWWDGAELYATAMVVLAGLGPIGKWRRDAGLIRLVKWRVLDELRKADGSRRIHRGWLMRLKDVELRAPGPDLDILLDAERAWRLVDKLPARWASVMRWRYQDGVLFREIGRRLGVNESRASQIHSAALVKLRQLMEGAQ